MNNNTENNQTNVVPANSNKVVIFLIISILILLSLGAGYYFYVRSSTESPTQKLNYNPFVKMVGSEDGTQYKISNLRASNEAMKTELDAIENKESVEYFSKYAVYLQAQASMNISDYTASKEKKENKFIEINNLIFETLEKISSLEQSDKLSPDSAAFLRARYFYIVSYIYDNAPASTFTSSSWGETSDYELVKSKYANSITAANMYLYKLANDYQLDKDSLSVSITMHIITRILNVHHENIDKATKELLVKDLEQSKTLFESASKTKMFSSPQYVVVFPARFYLEALPVLARNGVGISQTQVKAAYENLLSMITESAKGEKDVVHSFKLFGQIAYASYLFEISDNKISPELKKLLGEIIAYPDTLSGTPELLFVFNSYIRSITANKTVDIVKNNIIEIAKQDEDFKRFMVKASTAK